MKRLIEKHLQNGRGRGVILLPEAYIQSLLAIPGTNTTSNTLVQQANQQARLDNASLRRILYLLLPGEVVYTNPHTGEQSIIKTKNASISQDTRTNELRKQDLSWAEYKLLLIRLEKAKEETAQAFNAVLERTLPSYWFEQATGEKPNAAEALAIDLFSPSLITKGTRLLGNTIKGVGKGINYLTRMDMPRFGYAPTTQYYFRPGYAGVNWFGLKKSPKVVQSQVVAEQPKTNPLSLITDSERYGEGYKLITLEDLQKLALERIGRKLTNLELKDYIGHRKIQLPNQEEFLGFAPRNGDFSKEGNFVLEDSDLSEALSNFNKFTDEGTIRTKLGNERYTEKEILSMLDENGNLKSNVALLRMYPGEHGVSNWYDRGDNASDMAVKYFKTKYDTGALMGILRDNPYDRSGVLIRPEDYEYSFDSFDVALNYLDRALGKKLRNFYELNPKTTYVLGNNYGQLKRYKEIDFDPEFSELLKSNKGELPDGAEVFKTKNEDIVIKYGGRKVGTLRPRSNQEIIDEYKPIIDNLNNTYNLNIGYPELNLFGKIKWPNIYGILYKQGGAINFFKYKHSKFFKNYVSNNIQNK